jgi:hypothetical protein
MIINGLKQNDLFGFSCWSSRFSVLFHPFSPSPPLPFLSYLSDPSDLSDLSDLSDN